jgi:hypothetical protein
VSGDECELADGGSCLEFRQHLRPLGQLVAGGPVGAEHARRDEPEHLRHDLAEELRLEPDEGADVQAGELHLVPVDEVPVHACIDAVARYCTTVVHGLSIQARDGADRTDLEAVITGAMAGWGALTAPRPVPGPST